MELSSEMEATMRSDDVDRYVALMAEDFEYVWHKSGDALGRAEMAALLRKVWRVGKAASKGVRDDCPAVLPAGKG